MSEDLSKIKNIQQGSTLMLVFALLLFAIIYFLFATHFLGMVHISLPRNGLGTYDALAESILSGHLDIQFSLSDRRLRHIVMDLSQFNGKFYLPWGIAPVIFFYAPFRAIFGSGLPDVVVVYLFMLGAYFFTCLIVLKIRNKFYPSVSRGCVAGVLAVLGMGNTACYMLKQARVYEAAYASGHFFFMGGLCAIVVWLIKNKIGIRYLVLASLSFGACILSQPHYVPAVMCTLLFLGYGIYFLDASGGRAIKWLALFVPFVIGASIAASYNYARFDNLLESGYGYQQNGFRFIRLTVLTLPRNIYWQIFQPPSLIDHFPFLRPRGSDSISSFLHFQLEPYNYKAVSLLYLSPFVWVLLGLLQKAKFYVKGGVDYLIKFKNSGLLHASNIQTIKWVAVVTLVCNLLVILLYPYNDFRYQMVYGTSLYLVATLAWFDLIASHANRSPGLKGVIANPSFWLVFLSAVTFLINFLAAFF